MNVPGKKFKTNPRLWLLIFLILFVPPWFFWRFGRDKDIHPADLFLILFRNPGNLTEVVFGIFTFCIIFGIPALALGWVLQGVLVTAIDFFKSKIKH